jgi:hypothetical protein
MADPKNQAFKPSFSKELNIESIISAPLVAASKANVVMVTGQTRFLLEYCFTKKKDSDTYEPVMIEMLMTRGEIVPGEKDGDPNKIKRHELTFNLPLLTLITLNSLAIDKVNVDFDMEITSVTFYEPIGEIGKQKIPLDRQAQLNGRISYDPKQQSNDKAQDKSTMRSRLKVNINAGPLPLPVGVLTIIDLYSKSIQPLPSKIKTEVQEEKK